MRLELLMACFVLLSSRIFRGQTASPMCSATSTMAVYSNASYSPESGDVSGYELALAQQTTGGHALLFVYEGAPNEAGIELTVEGTGQRFTLTGTWVEHLIEYPSRKETTQTHPVRLEATVSSAALRGKLTIDQYAEVVRLKRAGHIWLCKGPKSKAPPPQ